VPARMKYIGNFSDASLERLHSVSISCAMSPSDAFDLESPVTQCIWYYDATAM